MIEPVSSTGSAVSDTGSAVSNPSELQVVILAGGLGSRLMEETETRPKPMVEIGSRPILWHLMKGFSHHGVNRFVVCLGYKGYVIKEYFSNYFLHNADVTFDLANNEVDYHACKAEPWHVTLVDTGQGTMTGGRLRRVRDHLDPRRPFLMTYGDGLADVDIRDLVDFHMSHGSRATMTVVRPPSRFGSVGLDGTTVAEFTEKPEGAGAYINGGFFVLDPSVIDLIDGDGTVWEREPLEALASHGELQAFRHDGFFKPMDTLREKKELEAMWASGKAPWMLW
jgi:glucose-1-phosphate cytidylyltransferase